MKPFQREAARYTPFFCEENIWWLAKSLLADGVDADLLKVVVFSNPLASILLFNQRAAAEGGPIIWDYHVVLQARIEDSDWIFDPDSRLSFPEHRETYLLHTFPRQSTLPERYRAWARIIPADSYLKHFYSDRTHMIGQIPASEFPDYPIIQPAAGLDRIPLSEYWDMHKSLPDGSRITAVDSLMHSAG